jgi:hypothetical protein
MLSGPLRCYLNLCRGGGGGGRYDNQSGRGEQIFHFDYHISMVWLFRVCKNAFTQTIN